MPGVPDGAMALWVHVNINVSDYAASAQRIPPQVNFQGFL